MNDKTVPDCHGGSINLKFIKLHTSKNVNFTTWFKKIIKCKKKVESDVNTDSVTCDYRPLLHYRLKALYQNNDVLKK